MGNIKVLIFIVSYNAERTIGDVLDRIPSKLLNNEQFEFEVLIIDDCSNDATFEKSFQHSQVSTQFPIRVLKNPKNLGYGGNQKLGYQYAVEKGFDVVALIHGDGQYAPEELPNLLQPLAKGDADAVFGSRMITQGAARKGGMPLYKYYGNKILSFFQNRIVGTTLSEYHSGYRLYSCAALAQIPFEQNSNGFDFDTEIIIQFHRADLKIVELSIPTFYGDEICYVQGIPYAWKVLVTSLKSRLQDFGLMYDPKFDVSAAASPYQPKFSFASSHSFALEAVSPGEQLLILGCGPVDIIKPFVEKGCVVTVVDQKISDEHRALAVAAFEADLNDCDLQQFFHNQIDAVLLLDVIEHLHDPEVFLERIRTCMDPQASRIIISTPNIAFILMRFSLLLGQFNYGLRGILDRTHTRLFTFSSLRRTLLQRGYSITWAQGVPAPFPLALGIKSMLAKILLNFNSLALLLSTNMFSYQAFVVASPNPSISNLLSQSVDHTNETIRNLCSAQISNWS
jgi:glycosyltransferase involved in cell wall biosynthesis